MNYEVDFSDRSFVVSFAKASSAAIAKYHFDIVEWFKFSLSTALFDEYEYACDVYSQSETYIVNQFIEEKENSNIKTGSEFQLKHLNSYCDIAYWIGYVFMSWKLVDKIKGSDILRYDMDEIVYSYDVLHTQSVSYSIFSIKENYLTEDDENE